MIIECLAPGSTWYEIEPEAGRRIRYAVRGRRIVAALTVLGQDTTRDIADTPGSALAWMIDQLAALEDVMSLEFAATRCSFALVCQD